MFHLPGDENISPEEQPVIPRRHPREDTEMDITPMIDITFLLLIFFLVAAKIDDQASVDLPSAKHGVLVASKNSIVITIAKGGGDGDARIYKGNGIVEANLFSDDKEEQEKQIQEFIDAGLKGEAPFDAPKTNVLIKAQKGLKQREVARVIKAASMSPDGEPLQLEELHVAVLEEP